jgi:hypothetical protein
MPRQYLTTDKEGLYASFLLNFRDWPCVYASQCCDLSTQFWASSRASNDPTGGSDENDRSENASVEWNEAEAPFHTVARLTLLSKSLLPPDAADTAYIDVTGHSTPDSTPLGSINRARWPAEVASRKARARTDARQ